ncbi:hypothetical protein ACP26L_17295 [Paenibacillus sp. S-38]|uniref:hypothetical protein n=1 Tax=Paenibacillus sp. S-38 TaxID=3416710 RepID=UPI003CE6D611
MTDLIVLLLVSAVAAGLLLAASKRKKQREDAKLRITPPLDAIPVDDTPDRPQPFGYKAQWYAVRTTDTRAVVEAFGLREPVPCNWNSGLRLAAAFSAVFVTPPLGEWTLVTGWSLPDLSSSQEEAYSVTSLLTKLSRRFGEAHYYATHRVVEYHAWVKAAEGKLVRGCSYVGESDSGVLDCGDSTPEERSLGLHFEDRASQEEEGKGDGRPTEEDVLAMAGMWSVNPLMPPDEQAGVGWAGGLPRRDA